jgi:hypothetical protein
MLSSLIACSRNYGKKVLIRFWDSVNNVLPINTKLLQLRNTRIKIKFITRVYVVCDFDTYVLPFGLIKTFEFE